MKLLRLGILLWCLSVIAPAAAADQTDRAGAALRDYLIAEYGSLEASPISSGILYDLVLPLSGLTTQDGSDAPPITTRQWLQMSHELRRASLRESAIPAHDGLRDHGNSLAREHVYSIAILDFEYDHLNEAVDPQIAIRFEGDRIESIDAAALERARAFAVAALRPWTYRGSSVRFRLDPQLYFTNLQEKPPKLEIDFDDGIGFRTIAGDDVTAHYSESGWKTIHVRVVKPGGETLRGSFRFEVRSLDAPLPHATWQVQGAVPYEGDVATGEAYVYLSDQHTVLTNPVIMVEGLDLTNSLNWDELYDLLNQEELIETLRALGYDAVVLNYDESTTYVQRNGLLVAALMDRVTQEVGGPYSSVLAGTSMGGVTTRYALSYMESNSLPHQVRTLISFDSPQNGANIPLGIQYWTEFFSGQSADAAVMRDALNTPAARQLLVVHFTSPPSGVAAPDPMRATLLSDLAALGNYPSQPRLVAMANGSGTAQGVGFSPGDQLVLWEYRSLLVDITGNVWALNDAQAQTVFDGEINLIWPLPDEYLTVTVQPTWPWDNAPGGLSPSMREMGEIEMPYGDLVALHDDHCFIPTISALDLSVSDPFHDIAGDADLYSLTPFDSLYYPIENQDHVAITPENRWWLLAEIVESLPTPTVVAALAGDSLRLSWSPVIGARSYRVYDSDDTETWPETYTLVGDTGVTIAPDLDRRYFRVAASFDAVP